MLQKPSFQLFDVRGGQCIYQPYSMFSRLPSSLSLTLRASENHGSAVLILLDLGFEKIHMQPFLDLADYSMILAAYHHGILTNPNILEIATNRNIVQHQLLLLPRFKDIQSRG
jgi:hypothetical protein